MLISARVERTGKAAELVCRVMGLQIFIKSTNSWGESQVTVIDGGKWSIHLVQGLKPISTTARHKPECHLDALELCFQSEKHRGKVRMPPIPHS